MDWSKVPTLPVKVFYPGQAALEWVMNKPDHSSAADIIEKKRPCAKCHSGDANEVGAAIVAGKPVGASKTILEPNPPAGKVGFIPVNVQATHDGKKSTSVSNGFRPRMATRNSIRRTKSN
jgi:hypothetical protein